MMAKDVKDIQETVSSILSLSTAGVAISGLGLVTSIAGFALLNQRFNQVDKRLTEIVNIGKDIKNFLSSYQMAKLQGAIQAMHHAAFSSDRDVRRGLLLQSKRDFTNLANQYGDLWNKSEDIKQIPILEDCFVVASTGAALATSDLGMPEVAAVEFKNHYEVWKTTAQKQIKQRLFGDDSYRLLLTATADVMPTRELIKVLDFANGTQKGLDWIDDLRRDQLTKSSMVNRFFSATPQGVQRLLKDEENPSAIKMATELCAKDEILKVNMAHLSFLGEKKLTASQFAKSIEAAGKELGASAVCVYADTGHNEGVPNPQL
jgi:hypothetical protein